MGNGSENRFRLLPVVVAIFVATGALLTFPEVWADAPYDKWQFFKPIMLRDDLPDDQLVELEVDPEVYAQAQSGLDDARLTASGTDGEREIPYILMVRAGSRDRAAIETQLQDLGRVPGDYISFMLQALSDGDRHNGVVIHTASTNFQRRVTVSASDDGDSWRVLAENGTIFDLTIPERGFSARDTHVTYPTSSARFLKVEIFDEGQESLDVRDISALSPLKREARLHHLPMDIVQRSEEPDHQRTIILLRAGSPGFPADSIRLDIPQRDFFREVAVEGSYDSIHWIPLKSGETLYDFDTPRFVGDDREMRFGESRHLYYRITIFNEDNPPLPVERAVASGFARKIVFTAAPGETYRLYYGNPEASAPSYELDKLFPWYLLTDDLPAAWLGPYEVNLAFAVPAPFTQRYPWLLPVLAAAAALLLGLFLASLIRQVRGRLRPPEQLEEGNTRDRMG